MRFLLKLVSGKIGPQLHLNGFHVFPRETSIKLLLFCITQSLNIQTHSHLLYWLVSFCIQMANNSGVAFSLLFRIYFICENTHTLFEIDFVIEI